MVGLAITAAQEEDQGLVRQVLDPVLQRVGDDRIVVSAILD